MPALGRLTLTLGRFPPGRFPPGRSPPVSGRLVFALGAWRCIFKLGLLRVALVQQKGAAEDLHHVHPWFGAESLGKLEACLGALAAQFHFDEFVIEQGLADLLEDRHDCALFADLDHRSQGVTEPTQMAAKRC